MPCLHGCNCLKGLFCRVGAIVGIPGIQLRSMKHRFQRKIQTVFVAGQNRIFTAFLLLLFFSLFLGDGKQAVVDIYGSAITLVMVFMFTTYGRPRRRLPASILYAWSGLLGWLCISTLYSIDIGYSLYTIVRFAEAFVLYYLFYVYTSGASPAFSRFLVGFAVLSVVLSALSFIIPWFMHMPTMNLIWSRAGHNHVADVLLLALFPSLVLIGVGPGALVLISTMYLLLFTFFRARAALSLIVVSIALYYSAAMQHSRNGYKYGAILVLVSMLVVSVSYFVPTRLSGAFGSVSQKTLLPEDRRFDYWKQAVMAIQESPVYGNGPGTFALLSKRYQASAGDSSWFAHNYLLEIAAETGLVGIGLFSSVLYVSLFRPLFIRKKIRAQKEHAALMGSVFLILMYGLVDFSLNYLIIWFIVWASIGIVTTYET